MRQADMLPLDAGTASIAFAGALLMVGCRVAALVELTRSRHLVAAWLLVIQDSPRGLGLKTAAFLPKTVEIHGWNRIAAFAAILALRVLVKRAMTWKEAHLRSPAGTQESRLPRRGTSGALAA